MSSSPGDSKGTDASLPAPVPTTAALPWAAKEDAAAAAANAAPPPPSIADRPLALADVGLAPGDRVEVKWRVHPDEGPTYSRWWGARVVGPFVVAAVAKKEEEEGKAGDAAEAAAPDANATPAPPQPPLPPLYELVYDAHEGFEEERAVVKFLGPHRVAEASAEDKGEAKKEKDEDDATPQLLPWRREGDAYDEATSDEDDEDDEEDGEGAVDAAGVVSVKELQQSGALLGEREALEAEAAALSGLPADQQRAVASGFRDYIDTFKAFVRAKMAEAQQQQQEQGQEQQEAGGAAAAGEGGAAGGGGGDAAAAPGAAPGGAEPTLTITAEMVAEFNAVVRNAKRARVDGGLPNVAPKG